MIFFNFPSIFFQFSINFFLIFWISLQPEIWLCEIWNLENWKILKHGNNYVTIWIRTYGKCDLNLKIQNNSKIKHFITTKWMINQSIQSKKVCIFYISHDSGAFWIFLKVKPTIQSYFRVDYGKSISRNKKMNEYCVNKFWNYLNQAIQSYLRVDYGKLLSRNKKNEWILCEKILKIS